MLCLHGEARWNTLRAEEARRRVSWRALKTSKSRWRWFTLLWLLEDVDVVEARRMAWHVWVEAGWWWALGTDR